MDQRIISSVNEYTELEKWFTENAAGMSLLLVHDDSLKFMGGFKKRLEEIAEEKNTSIVYFSDFQPNPLYESVVKGVELYRDHSCSAIISVGGGSALDVAKCIKLYSNLPGDGDDGLWLKADIVPNNIPFLPCPQPQGLVLKRPDMQ